MLVDAVDDRRVGRLAGRRKQHLLRTLIKMHLALGLGIESARAFHHEVDAKVGPGQFARIARAEDAHAIAVDDHVIAVGFDRRIKAAVNGVVAQEMCIDVHITRGIHGDDFNVVLLAGFVVSTQNIAADATEAVDGDANCHFLLS